MEIGEQNFKPAKESSLESAKREISLLRDHSSAKNSLTELERIDVDKIDEEDVEIWRKINSIRSKEDYSSAVEAFNRYRNSFASSDDVSETKKRLCGALGNYLQQIQNKL